jgi:hypothetical protein
VSTEDSDEWFQKLRRRFFSKVIVGPPEECWLWQASVQQSGYGMFGLGSRHAGKSRPAYIASYIIHHDPHYRDYDVDRFRMTCRNPRCVNPRHILRLTPAEQEAHFDHHAPGVIEALMREFPSAHEPLAEALKRVLQELNNAAAREQERYAHERAQKGREDEPEDL